MGAKGSKQSIPSRFKAADFFFGESASLGCPSQPTAMHLYEEEISTDAPYLSTTALPTAAATPPPNAASPSRLLCVGCADGAVLVYGSEGVHTRLFELPNVAGARGDGEIADDEDAAASKPASSQQQQQQQANENSNSVLFLHALPRSMLVSVHPTSIKLWSLEGMCEVFCLRMGEVPRDANSAPKGVTLAPYVLTCAAMANEYDRRYIWLGTQQGEVLMFDCVKKRMSAYRVPLLSEVNQHVSESASALNNTLPQVGGAFNPMAVTCIAQLPSDSSQLLIGFACDLVLTWHISTSKLHRSYKRSACGGVTSICWECDPGKMSEHFVVGHRNGMIAVWKRKYHHSPSAVFFLSQTPGARHPIACLKWSSRTFGFFVSGGHIMQMPAEGEREPIESGGVVFVSGAKFEHRKLCTVGGNEPQKREENSSAPPAAVSSTNAGVKEFFQVIMTRPAPVNANPNPATPPPKAHTTPVFICLEQAGHMRVHFPTVMPPVPPIPVTHMHEQPNDSVLLLSASTADEQISLRGLLGSLRAIAPTFRPWLSLVRQSLANQHLWPLNGGLNSTQMHEIELEEERMFRKLNPDGKVDPADTMASLSIGQTLPDPALLITAHSSPEVCIRLSDATSPFQIDLLAVLSLKNVLAAGASVTCTHFCLARKELVFGTSTGEIFIYVLRKIQPTPPAAAADGTPAATAPADQSSAPQPASPTAAASSSSSTPAMDWSLDLVHRIPFSNRSIRLILYASQVDKYAVVDSADSFTFLRPDTGVILKQTIPNATITAAHFSSEALVKPKTGVPMSLLFLYLCGSDGSIHVFAADLEAKLAVIPSISADESRLEVINMMQTISIKQNSNEAVVAGSGADVGSGQQYVICCTQQSIKLLTGGTKGVESLLSLRTAEAIRLAFLVCSPHLIEQRDEIVKAGGKNGPGSSSAAPEGVAAPARELCLGIVDAKAVLTVYSVQLKILFSAPLQMSPERVSAATFSMSGDGRVAFLPTPTFLTEAQLFPNKHYNFSAPPARLVKPIERSIEEIEAAGAAEGAKEAPATSSWFSSLLPVVASHSSLFDVQMYEPVDNEEVFDPPPRQPSVPVDEDEQPSRSASSTPGPRLERQSSASSTASGSTPSRAGASSSSSAAPASTATPNAAVNSAKQTMAQNRDIAAKNLSKAEELADKADEMADHANDFLAAARKLRQQQQNSWW